MFELRYSYGGKRKVITLGEYPDISLLVARKKALEYRQYLLHRQDPQLLGGQEKKQSIESQIHMIYKRWSALQKSKNFCKKTYQRYNFFFYDTLLPHFCEYNDNKKILSSLNINEISHLEIIEIILESEKNRGSDFAKRFSHFVKNLWEYAFLIGLSRENVFSGVQISRILSPTQEVHYPKITDEAILGELMRCIESYPHSFMIRSALLFVAYVPLRSANLCKLRWEQIDLEKRILTIPRSEMKRNNQVLPDFKIPLSLQALRVLREIKVFTGFGEWVFHSASNHKKPMVGDSLTKALRIMGFNDEKRGRKQVVHSFRGTFRSLVDTYQDRHNAPFEVKEAMLDHSVGNEVTLAYNHRADWSEQGRGLMQWWGDFLDRIKGQ
ncbi:hypothetical protein BKH46_08385 [Helicobacter sp. 12S02634-8]|nr:hypothetical protein BKH46_08385 [Helicobacter sp. 12S02634-8]